MTEYHFSPEQHEKIGRAFEEAMSKHHPVTEGLTIRLDGVDGTVELQRDRNEGNPFVYRNDEITHNGHRLFLGHIRKDLDLDVIVELDKENKNLKPQEFFDAHQKRCREKYGTDFIVNEKFYID